MALETDKRFTSIDNGNIQVDEITLISSDQKEFQVQRKKVQYQSDYFRGLFESGMKESRDEKIHLMTIHSDQLRTILVYVEQQSVSDIIDMSGISELLTAAIYLQMAALVQHCCEFIEAHMGADNVKMVIGLAEEWSINRLKTFADNYVLNHVMEFSETEDFLNLDLDEIVGLLDNDDLYVMSEKQVFVLAMKWLDVHPERETNTETCLQVLNTVRFEFCKENLFHADMEKEFRSRNMIDRCQPILDEQIENTSYVQQQLDCPSLKVLHDRSKKYRPRCEVDCLVATGGFTCSELATNKFQVLPMKNLLQSGDTFPKEVKLRHLRTANMICKRCEHCTCVVNNILYVIGGQNKYCTDGRYTLNTVSCYDVRKNVWNQVNLI